MTAQILIAKQSQEIMMCEDYAKMLIERGKVSSLFTYKNALKFELLHRTEMRLIIINSNSRDFFSLIQLSSEQSC